MFTLTLLMYQKGQTFLSPFTNQRPKAKSMQQKRSEKKKQKTKGTAKGTAGMISPAVPFVFELNLLMLVIFQFFP